MKAVITKQQFIKKIGLEKKQSLEQRFNINLDSDITMEEIYNLLAHEQHELLKAIKQHENNSNKD